MNETTHNIYRRMVTFGARILRLSDELYDRHGGRIVANQICRSATSIGANYRESQRARTRTEFASKLQVSLQEADETLHWLELIREAELLPRAKVAPLLQEGNEFVSILVSAVRSSKNRP